MKYQDSINQANKLLTLSIKQLELWFLAATPINYAVSYEFVRGNNKPLMTAIKYQLSTGKKLDNFYKQLLLSYILYQVFYPSLPSYVVV